MERLCEIMCMSKSVSVRKQWRCISEDIVCMHTYSMALVQSAQDECVINVCMKEILCLDLCVRQSRGFEACM